MEPARDRRFGEDASEHLSLLLPLGRGGMASVWRARHRDFPTPVAVKFIPSDLATGEDGHARLLREGRILARIDSPLVVRLLAIHDAAPWPFLVLEELRGEGLASFAKARSRVPLRTAAGLVRGVGAAVEEVHAAGVVHGDVKPTNVFLARTLGGAQPGVTVKLLDFGVSRSVEERTLESDRYPAGTPDYMSPEQVLSPLDPRTSWDVWALAVLAYHLLTGAAPFDAHSRVSTFLRASSAACLPPSCLRPDLSPRVDTVFARAFRREPERRFRTVLELVGALVEVLGQCRDTALVADSEVRLRSAFTPTR